MTTKVFEMRYDDVNTYLSLSDHKNIDDELNRYLSNYLYLFEEIYQLTNEYKDYKSYIEEIEQKQFIKILYYFDTKICNKLLNEINILLNDRIDEIDSLREQVIEKYYIDLKY